jgi:hypothetical protein
METIATRFALINALNVNRIWRQRPTGNKNEPGSDSKSKQVKKVEQEIEQDFNFVKKLNQSGFLSEEDLGTLQAIASKTYKDLRGNVKPYLTDQEVEALSVKKGNLTPEEYGRIQTHVELTHNIVKNIPFTKSLKDVPFFSASHHELLDGTGYPKGLKGDEIPIQCRILAVVDIFDALTAADRPYRRAVSSEKGGKILKAEAETGRLDKDIVNLFVDKELYKI